MSPHPKITMQQWLHTSWGHFLIQLLIPVPIVQKKEDKFISFAGVSVLGIRSGRW